MERIAPIIINIFSIIIDIIFAIIMFIILFIFPIAIFYFAIRYAIKKARKENMSKIDFSREKEYYREILKAYSPAELSYIDDFKIGIPREIVATILNLQLKGKIEINKNQIIVIDSNQDGLKKTEKFVLQNIKDGKVEVENAGYIESYAQDEAIEDNLIVENTDGKKKIKSNIIKTILIDIGLFILFIMLASNTEKDAIILDIATFISAVTLLCSLIATPIVNIVYALMQINSYKRTEEGEKINKKIEGLKKYMTDYSTFNERGKDELIIWEEYLIYSVIFGLNHTIEQEISSLIEIKFDYKLQV